MKYVYNILSSIRFSCTRFLILIHYLIFTCIIIVNYGTFCIVIKRFISQRIIVVCNNLYFLYIAPDFCFPISLSHYHIIGATVKNLHDRKSREYSGQNSELIKRCIQHLHLLILMSSSAYTANKSFDNLNKVSFHRLTYVPWNTIFRICYNPILYPYRLDRDILSQFFIT